MHCDMLVLFEDLLPARKLLERLAFTDGRICGLIVHIFSCPSRFLGTVSVESCNNYSLPVSNIKDRIKEWTAKATLDGSVFLFLSMYLFLALLSHSMYWRGTSTIVKEIQKEIDNWITILPCFTDCAICPKYLKQRLFSITCVFFRTEKLPSCIYAGSYNLVITDLLGYPETTLYVQL